MGAFIYALCMSLLHVIINAGFSATPIDQAFLGRILMAFPVHFLFAIPAAWLSCGTPIYQRSLGAVIFLILIIFEVVGFHVEAATGKYLQASEYSYIRELGHIWPSIRDSGMLLWGLLEMSLCFLIVLLAQRVIGAGFDRGTIGRPSAV